MAGVSSGVKSWLLDKYAKFIPTKNVGELSVAPVELSFSKSGGEWKQYSSLEGDGSLQVTLIEDKHLMLSSGTQVHESYTLVNASKWLKAVCKGDSVLFIININNEARRFRVKFANTGTRTGWDNSHDFTSCVSSLFPVKEVPISENAGSASQSQFVEDSQLLPVLPANIVASQVNQGSSFASGAKLPGVQGSTIPEITRQVLSQDQAQPVGFVSTNLPTSDLPTLIRLCLTDPSFPDFVNKVEQELKILTNQR